MRLPSRSLTHTVTHAAIVYSISHAISRTHEARKIEIFCRVSVRLVRHNDVQINTRKHIHTHTCRQTDTDRSSLVRSAMHSEKRTPPRSPFHLSLSLSLLAILLVPFHTPLITFSSPPRFPACLPNPAQSSLPSRRSRFQHAPFPLSIFHHSLIINKLKIQNEINSLLVTKKS